MRIPKLVATIATMTAFSASVNALSIDLNQTFNGTSPEGPAPWLNATFTDLGGGIVQLKLTDVGLTGSEFVAGWYLNLDPGLDPTKINVTAVDVSDVSSWTVQKRANTYAAGNDGFFDLRFNLPTTGDNRFVAGDELIFNLQYNSGTTLNPDDFNFVSEGGKNGFLSAARVRGIGAKANNGWIADGGNINVPDGGATAAMLGLGIIGLAVLRRKQRS
jgi:hypothetical protein